MFNFKASINDWNTSSVKNIVFEMADNSNPGDSFTLKGPAISNSFYE